MNLGETISKIAEEGLGDSIIISKQSDGNWKGWATRYGKVVEVREIKPEDCLVRLLTHDGQ